MVAASLTSNAKRYIVYIHDKELLGMEKQLTSCHCLNIRRASNKITEMFDQSLDPVGLTNGQFSILRYIKYLAPISVSQLSEQLNLDRTTLVRNLKLLESQGFVRDISQKGRGRQLELTEAGLQRQMEGEILWQEAKTRFEEKLGKDKMESYYEVMKAIFNME
jgi:DNA-binding MarR family transcriptional regulator